MTARIVNFGSINIDHVYRVPHFVQPGETISSIDLSTGLGGKGANQSVAIAKAGVAVSHIGRVSDRDQWAIDLMASQGVNIEQIEAVSEPSGHAIIQVDDKGENAIVLHGGANQTFARAKLEKALSENKSAEFLLMQNECNLLEEAFEIARALKLKIALNPAPMTDSIKQLPLELLDTLIVNQVEAEALADESDLDAIVSNLIAMLPDTRIVLTLGSKGALMVSNGAVIEVAATPVDVVDTTGAGDTFVGYFLAGLVETLEDQQALRRACRAAALTVTKAGAISSIPSLSDLRNA